MEVPAKRDKADERQNFIIRFIERIEDFFVAIGDLSIFAFRTLRDAFRPPFELSEFLKQCYLAGNKSFPLVATTAFIMGLVFTMQSRPTLSKFGAQSWLPAMVSIAMVREIAPVITALICAGKVGSGMGAEIASMVVTEQIDAMEVAGNRPFKYVVVTRVFAITIMLPVLVVFADSIAVVGSLIGVNLEDNTTFQLFFNHVFHALDFTDLFPALIKTFFFGFAIGIVSCYQGYTNKGGTEGVGRAANSAVVISSLLIFLLDLIAVEITNSLGY